MKLPIKKELIAGEAIMKDTSKKTCLELNNP